MRSDAGGMALPYWRSAGEVERGRLVSDKDSGPYQNVLVWSVVQSVPVLQGEMMRMSARWEMQNRAHGAVTCLGGSS